MSKKTKNDILVYPTIFEEFNDEDGHYYVVTSPNIPGMVTQGDTLTESVEQAQDAIATMLDGEEIYPDPQDPATWVPLADNERLVYITVNMTNYMATKPSKSVITSVSLPENLLKAAKARNINLSRVVQDGIKQKLA